MKIRQLMKQLEKFIFENGKVPKWLSLKNEEIITEAYPSVGPVLKVPNGQIIKRGNGQLLYTDDFDKTYLALARFFKETPGVINSNIELKQNIIHPTFILAQSTIEFDYEIIISPRVRKLGKT